MRKVNFFRICLIFIVINFIACQEENNREEVIPKKSQDFVMLAHRGLHQDFSKENLDNKTCTAKRILKPEHPYLENTIDSIEKAFELGATVVEIDVYNTLDGHVVVFHDAMLECRTNGTGKASDHDLAYLKSLDIGHGYSHDGGKTYPFRGKGIGKMPTLLEVLQRFPDKQFLLDYKQGNYEVTAILIADIIASLPSEQQKNIYCEGQDSKFKEIVRSKVAGFYCLSPGSSQVKDWLISYFISFGINDSVEELDNNVVVVPIEYAGYLWGWPEQLISKVHQSGGKVFVYVNTREEALELKKLPLDGIITDHVDKLEGVF